MSMKPATKWGDRVARREDILAAGRGLLERDGYAGLAMRAVADRAGVSPGTLYTYFASKEALFAALYTERLEELERELREEAFCGLRTAEDVIVAFMERWFPVYTLFGHQIDVWGSLAGDSVLPPDEGQRLVAAAVSVITSVRDELGRFEPGLPEAPGLGLAVPFVWSAVNGLAEHFRGPRHGLHPYSRDELARFAARALVDGVRAALGLTDATTTRS
jgi:AcrR family transcriptional regulator